MAGAWRRVRAAAQNREEEERRRLTGGPGRKILFISFFFLGCDNKEINQAQQHVHTMPASLMEAINNTISTGKSRKQSDE